MQFTHKNIFKKNAWLLVMLMIFSCKSKVDSNEFEIFYSANDTIKGGNIYSTRFGFKNIPDNFKLDGFFWSGYPLRVDSLSTLVEFYSSCNNDSIITKRSNKYIEKGLEFYIKGKYLNKDTIIHIKKSYWVDCN